MDLLDHRGVEPDRLAAAGDVDALAALGALADDGGRRHVTGLEGVHEDFTVRVDQLGAEAADFLRDERAEDLLGVRGAGRVVLHGVGEQKRSADAVREDETVRCGAVVVGSREALDVQSARTTGRDDGGLGAHDLELLRVGVDEHGTADVAALITEQFDAGRVVEARDPSAAGLVAEGPHDLGAGVVLRRMHAFPGGAAAVDGDQRAVFFFVELDAHVAEPLEAVRSLGDELVDKLLLAEVVAAAISVKEVLGRGVVGLRCTLDAAFRHHRVRVAEAELGRHEHGSSGVVRFDGGGTTGTAGADDQHVYVIVDVGQVYIANMDAALAHEGLGELRVDFVALVGPGPQFCVLVRAVVRVEALQKDVLFFRGHAFRLQRRVRFALFCYFLKGKL